MPKSIEFYDTPVSGVFTVPEYLEKEHIKVYCAPASLIFAEITFEWLTDSTINVTIPEGTVQMKIARETPGDARLVTYNNASLIKATEHNRDSTQLIYLIQELIEQTDNANAISEMMDALVTNPVDGQILRRINGKWTNSDDLAGMM